MSLNIPIKPLVLIGPSGSGRTAIAFRLTCQLPHKFSRVVSMTSRPPRPMQKQAFHFYFRSQEQMLRRNTKNEFLTFVLSPHNHYYGTQIEQVKKIIQASKIPILKLTLQSYMKNVMEQIECYALYIDVHDMKQIQKRLKLGPFSSQQIEEKLKSAAEQQRQALKYFREQNIIHNNNVEEALSKIKARLFQLY